MDKLTGGGSQGGSGQEDEEPDFEEMQVGGGDYIHDYVRRGVVDVGRRGVVEGARASRACRTGYVPMSPPTGGGRSGLRWSGTM